MESRKISREEQGCISNCILAHWGDRDSDQDPEERDDAYEKCLTDCQVCG